MIPLLKVRVECKNTSCEGVAKLLENFLYSEYRVWSYGESVYFAVKVPSISALDELAERLKSRNFEFNFSKIEKVLP